MTSNDDVLNSWKEVANYLGRGVRTVQRWEQELSLPVRRPRGKSRSAVIAFKTELDLWLHESRVNPTAATAQLMLSPMPTPFLNSVRSSRTQLHDRTTALLTRMHELLSRSNGLCTRTKELSEQVNHMLVLAASNMEHSGGDGAQKVFISNKQSPVSIT